MPQPTDLYELNPVHRDLYDLHRVGHGPSGVCKTIMHLCPCRVDHYLHCLCRVDLGVSNVGVLSLFLRTFPRALRYTSEMVKLEASLAEMERELTRAETAHMRERRGLLEREASALGEGQRFRSRSVLLQGEVRPVFVIRSDGIQHHISREQ